MPTIGVLACQILELELAHLLAKDESITEIAVMDNESNQGFIQALERDNGAEAIRLAYYEELGSDDGPELRVLVKMLEVGLHRVIKRIQEGVVQGAGELAPYVDGLFLGYGLCGNALSDPKGLLRESGITIPVFIPMDDDHPVDDCVGLIIGGRENYYQEQCNVAGTMFMTPGFTRHWSTMMTDQRRGNMDWDMSKRMFAHYERNLFLTTPVLSTDVMLENVAEFNRHHGFRNEFREGTLDILHASWERAKGALAGDS